MIFVGICVVDCFFVCSQFLGCFYRVRSQMVFSSLSQNVIVVFQFFLLLFLSSLIIISLLNVVYLFSCGCQCRSLLFSSEVCWTTLLQLLLLLLVLLLLHFFLLHFELFLFVATLTRCQWFELFFHLSLIGTCHHCRIALPKMRFFLLYYIWLSHYAGYNNRSKKRKRLCGMHVIVVVVVAGFTTNAPDNNGNISNLFYCYYSIDLQFAYTFCPIILISCFISVFPHGLNHCSLFAASAPNSSSHLMKDIIHFLFTIQFHCALA